MRTVERVHKQDTQKLRKMQRQGASVAELASISGMTEHSVLYRLFPPDKAPFPVLTNKLNLRLDKDMHSRLMAEASRRGIHHSELVRTFIEWGLDS